MQAFIVSSLTIAGAEIGDKTQLLAFLLATRFKKPLIILIGIFIAALLSNILSVSLGTLLNYYLHGKFFDAILAISFLIAAIWLILPEKALHEQTDKFGNNALIATIFTFFVAELGDKTQLMTAVLAANYSSPLVITLGATLGLLLVNVPVIFLGSNTDKFASLTFIRYIAALIFLGIGIVTLVKVVH